MGNPTRFGIHSKLVLVRLNIAGRGYSHVGSINGSETSSKVNREVAVQVESQGLYAELARVFQADWNLSAPTFLPLVMRDYKPPDHIVISEVLYDPSGNPDTGKEWIELYNPTARAMDISGWSLGDATADGEYGSGRYLFPAGTVLQPVGVIVIAQQAADVAFTPNFEFLTDPNRDDLTVPNMLPAAAWDGFGLALSNAGDHVILRDAAGQVVDVVVWGEQQLSRHAAASGRDHERLIHWNAARRTTTRMTAPPISLTALRPRRARCLETPNHTRKTGRRPRLPACI